MKKVRVTKRQLNKYIKNLLQESRSNNVGLITLNSKNYKTIHNRDLFQEFISNLAQGEESQATGYGQTFENIYEQANPGKFASMNTSKNQAFADLLEDTGTKKILHSLKFSRRISVNDISGIRPDLAVTALAGQNIPNGIYYPGLIKGEIDIEAFGTMGNVGVLPIKVSRAMPNTDRYGGTVQYIKEGNKFKLFMQLNKGTAPDQKMVDNFKSLVEGLMGSSAMNNSKTVDGQGKVKKTPIGNLYGFYAETTFTDAMNFASGTAKTSVKVFKEFFMCDKAVDTDPEYILLSPYVSDNQLEAEIRQSLAGQPGTAHFNLFRREVANIVTNTLLSQANPDLNIPGSKIRNTSGIALAFRTLLSTPADMCTQSKEIIKTYTPNELTNNDQTSEYYYTPVREIPMTGIYADNSTIKHHDAISLNPNNIIKKQKVKLSNGTEYTKHELMKIFASVNYDPTELTALPAKYTTADKQAIIDATRECKAQLVTSYNYVKNNPLYNRVFMIAAQTFDEYLRKISLIAASGQKWYGFKRGGDKQEQEIFEEMVDNLFLHRYIITDRTLNRTQMKEAIKALSGIKEKIKKFINDNQTGFFSTNTDIDDLKTLLSEYRKKDNIKRLMLEREMETDISDIENIILNPAENEIIDKPPSIIPPVIQDIPDMPMPDLNVTLLIVYYQLVAEIIDDLFEAFSLIHDKQESEKTTIDSNQKKFSTTMQNEPISFDVLDIDESRLYESILFDLMEAATKKQQSVNQPKKIKITKRQLNRLLEISLKQNINESANKTLEDMLLSEDDFQVIQAIELLTPQLEEAVEERDSSRVMSLTMPVFKEFFKLNHELSNQRNIMSRYPDRRMEMARRKEAYYDYYDNNPSEMRQHYGSVEYPYEHIWADEEKEINANEVKTQSEINKLLEKYALFKEYLDISQEYHKYNPYLLDY